jgi:hypothetical protein
MMPSPPAPPFAPPLAAALDVAATLRAFAAVRAGGSGDELARLLSTSTLSSWAPLDRAARAITVAVDELRFQPWSFEALVLASMTRSGFTRLHVVGALRGHDHLAIAALLWRLDDVVWAVRSAAEAQLMRAMDLASPTTLAEVMPVVDAISVRERAHASAACRHIVERVRAAGVTANTRQSQEVQRSLRRLWATDERTDAEGRVAMARQALADGDVAFALSIAKRATVVMRPALSEAFAVHPVGAVRMRAAELGRGNSELLLGLSVDRRPEVRAAARVALSGMVDVQRDYARDVVDAAARPGGAPAAVEGVSTARLIGALGALAELGRPEDFGRISHFLHDERRRVQAEAVRAVVGSHASGGLVDYIDLLLDKVMSPSWRVGVEAARGLTWLPAERRPVAEIARADEQAHPAVRRVLAQLTKPGRWSC